MKMKDFNIGQAIQILANIGIIAGILFLAYELRQNNELMAAQARFNRLTISMDNWTMVALNPELAELRFKDMNNEKMTPLEQSRWEAYLMKIWVTREWSFKELPESELPVEVWIRATKELGSMRNVYEREKDGFDPEFTTWIDKTILNVTEEL